MCISIKDNFKKTENKTAIFDLDGTLLATLDDLADSVNIALTKHGYPTHETSKYCYFVGNGARALIERALPEEIQSNEEIVSKVLATYKEVYEVHYIDKTKPYDGIHTLLSTLNNMGIKLAVLSNKPDDKTKELTEHFFPDIPFAAVCGGRVGVPLKPDPKAVYEVLSICGGTPSKTFYMGDSGVDMITAKNAGIYACGATWGFRTADELEKAGADVLCDTPSNALERAIQFFNTIK